MATVFARSGYNKYAVKVSKNTGVIVFVNAKTKSPEMSLAAIESMGGNWRKTDKNDSNIPKVLQIAGERV